MNRNTFILFGGAIALLIVAVVLAIFLRGNKKENSSQVDINPPYEGYITPLPESGGSQLDSQNASQPASKTIGAITVYPPVAGWQVAENNNLGVSLKVPEDWDISGEVSKYDFKAAWVSEKASMAADIYSYDNKNKITPQEWAKNGGLTEFLPVSVDGISGVRYITKITYGAIFDEGASDEVEDSYIVGLLLPKGDKMIDVSCFTTGVDYAIYKSRCDEVINTFNFTQ